MLTADMLLIFDCDGVLVDSERLACIVEADYLASLGMPFTADDVAARFVGRSVKDMTAELVAEFGARVPADFGNELMRRTLQRFATELQPVSGVRAAIETLAHPRCVASSSTPDRISASLAAAGLSDLFSPALIFSTSMVARGKPAPDVFLHAARTMNHAPRDCVVIEDSLAGVAGAVEAGMTVIGFAGGSHVRDRAAHGETLTRMGARGVIDDMGDLAKAIDAIAANQK